LLVVHRLPHGNKAKYLAERREDIGVEIASKPAEEFKAESV
jgi:hypothetical protein